MIARIIRRLNKAKDRQRMLDRLDRELRRVCR